MKSRLTNKLLWKNGARLTFSIRVAALLLSASCVWTEAWAENFLINDAISQAVLTNPGVGEASANRRATETELRQTQSTLLPQVRLEARAGPERFNQQIVPPPLGNGQWLNGKSGSVVVRQILFDGLASIHDIWRQAARVNAASFRVRERTELIALDAAEAYIDVVRFVRLVALAGQNVANHEELFSHVKSRYSGGLAGEGDLQQALERVEAAKATRADFQRSLDDARSKYRKIIGLEAVNVVFPAPLRGLPRSKEDALAVALRRNPTLLAAESDKEAAKQAFRATDGAFVPNVSLEGRASHSLDADTFIGKRDDVAGKLVVSWDVFRGGQDSWHRAEMAERYTEETMRQARLQRDALEFGGQSLGCADDHREPHRRFDAPAFGRQENHRDLSQGIRDQTAKADRAGARRGLECGISRLCAIGFAGPTRALKPGLEHLRAGPARRAEY